MSVVYGGTTLNLTESDGRVRMEKYRENGNNAKRGFKVQVWVALGKH